MDTLHEIIHLLDRYKVRQIEVLTNTPEGKESRYFECYVGMRDGRWESEDDMALYFGLEPGSKAFTRFKNEVRKRLQNSILFIDTSLPEFNDYNRAGITLTQQWAIAKVLMFRGARKAFIEMAEQVLRVAIHFEFLDIVEEVLQLLITSIMPFPQFNKDFPKYLKMYEEYTAAHDAEKVVWKSITLLIWPLVTKKGIPAEHLEPIRQKVESLRPLADRFQYTYLQSHFRTMELYSAIFSNNWEEALEIARKAKAFFEAKPFRPIHHINKFALQESACLITLHRFQEARVLCRESMDILAEGVVSWFKFWEMETVAAFQGCEYADAWQSVKAAMRHPRFDTISVMDQESWRVFYGYLCLMSRLHILPLSPREKGEAEKFRLSSWLNDLPLHSTDKRGANIPILILQTLFLLAEERLDEFENRTEALRKYRQRNLELDSEHLRTDCFIRLLESIPKNNYQLKRILHESEKWLGKMKMGKTNILDYSYELEIIPYERQWEWTVNLLKKMG